jgi:Na+/melibiose symporter-like transporter
MKQLLARKDVRMLFGGQTLSMFGDWAMIIVLGIWAKDLTGSNSAAGLVFFVFALASLAAPVGGLVVDRMPKRSLMIATDVALAGVMCLLLLVHDRGDVWLLYFVTTLYGLGGDLFAASRSAMLKAMLPDELLAEANGIYQSIREGLRLVAPLAGAGIYAVWGGSAVALVNAGTFLASGVVLALMPFSEPPVAVKEHHLAREISAGVEHIAQSRVLRQLTIGVGAALLVAGFSETLLFAISTALGHSAKFIAVIGTAQGVGAIAGGITASRMMRRLGDIRLAGLGLALFGLGDCLWLFPRVEIVLPATAVAGLGIVWAVVALGTAYQTRSPMQMQGRVAAAANMLLSVPQTISIAAGAALVVLIDYRIEIAVMAVVFFASAAYLLTRSTEEETAEVELVAAA